MDTSQPREIQNMFGESGVLTGTGLPGLSCRRMERLVRFGDRGTESLLTPESCEEAAVWMEFKFNACLEIEQIPKLSCMLGPGLTLELEN